MAAVLVSAAFFLFLFCTIQKVLYLCGKEKDNMK